MGSYTKPSGLAANQGWLMLITNPVEVVLISGDSFCLLFKYCSFVDLSCRIPHLVAVLPVNLVYNNCFTVDATFVVDLLLAILPVFDAVMQHLLSASHLYIESSLLP